MGQTKFKHAIWAVLGLAFLSFAASHGGLWQARADSPVLCGAPGHETAPTYNNLGQPQCPPSSGTATGPSAGQTYVNGASNACDALYRMYQTDTQLANAAQGVSSQRDPDLAAARTAWTGWQQCLAQHGGGGGQVAAAPTTSFAPTSSYVPYTAKAGTTTWSQEYTHNMGVSMSNALGMMAQEQEDEEAQQQAEQEQQAQEQAQRDAEETQRRAEAAAQDAQRRAALDNPFSGGGASHASDNPFAQGGSGSDGTTRTASTGGNANGNPFASPDSGNGNGDTQNAGDQDKGQTCDKDLNDFQDARSHFDGDMKAKHDALAQVAYHEMEMVKSDAGRHGCDTSAYAIPPKPKFHIKTKSNEMGVKG